MLRLVSGCASVSNPDGTFLTTQGPDGDTTLGSDQTTATVTEQMMTTDELGNTEGSTPASMTTAVVATTLTTAMVSTTSTTMGPCPGTCTPITTTNTMFTEFGGCCFGYDMTMLTLVEPMMTSMDDGAGGCQQHFTCDGQLTHTLMIDMSPNAMKECTIRPRMEPFVQEIDAICDPEATNFIR
ncbi:hypothetical protein WR25_01494 [Diploscapter pachys]|uniref:Uncharacterized protein n=1 Tax=Diploscapter pachys TaxID=2018661 RepID=A0A2A2JR67_9BILA|nr:hypothetical protein WR25_01494 [Diploscapter pachys]